MPANSCTFLAQLMKILTFDIFDISSFHKKLYSLKDPDAYPPYNDNFEMMTYDNSNFIYNMGMAFVPIEVAIFFGVITGIGILLKPAR